MSFRATETMRTYYANQEIRLQLQCKSMNQWIKNTLKPAYDVEFSVKSECVFSPEDVRRIFTIFVNNAPIMRGSMFECLHAIFIQTNVIRSIFYLKTPQTKEQKDA